SGCAQARPGAGGQGRREWRCRERRRACTTRPTASNEGGTTGGGDRARGRAAGYAASPVSVRARDRGHTAARRAAWDPAGGPTIASVVGGGAALRTLLCRPPSEWLKR